MSVRSAAVVTARHMRLVEPDASLGVDQLLADACGLQPVGLFSVEAEVPFGQVWQHRQISLKRFRQFLRDADMTGGQGEGPAQAVDGLERVAYSVVVLEPDHLKSHLRSDIGIPIAITSDPRAKRERPRRVGDLDASGAQRVLPFAQDSADHRTGELVEVIHRVTSLVEGIGLGHP